jgi:hypothetical protein
VITRAVGSCDVLLALIGGEWLSITDAFGQCCLDNSDDFVRLEIEAALSRRIRVIPVLVDGARMPRAAELPDSVAALVRRQALELSPARFDFDISRLVKVLDRTLAEVRATQQDAAPVSAPTPTPTGTGTVPDIGQPRRSQPCENEHPCADSVGQQDGDVPEPLLTGHARILEKRRSGAVAPSSPACLRRS